VTTRRHFRLALPDGRSLHLGERTLIMGIINVTPDSFSDGGVLFDPARAVDAALRMIDEGADLLDIGGESTRPGAHALEAAEERRRVLPVIEALAPRVSVPLSVDTYKASIADAALQAGASIVNDISGLRYEPDLGGVAARHRAPLILMHTRGRSRDMYQQATYDDVVDEVIDELGQSIAFAVGAGVPREQLLVDPGLGFAKEPAHSYEALARLERFSELNRPLVVGASRKGFLTRPLGHDVPAADRDWATAAAVAASIAGGAHIVRVHAVREMRHVVRVADEIRKYHRDD
jgi:dihydropteroate synthase